MKAHSAATFTLPVLIGPTACGKSALAMALSHRLPLEIITMDSGQVYRGLDIGTAKPTMVEQSAVQHHLLDMVEPEEHYSAGRFCRDAASAVRDCLGRGHMPLVVGGTMMYYKALRDGLSVLPQADPAFRAELAQRAEIKGWPALHETLRQQDPQAASRLHPNDALRIMRALEIIHLTRLPLAQAQARRTTPLFALRTLALLPPAGQEMTWLYPLIHQRLMSMMNNGWVDEVRRLQTRPGFTRQAPALRRVGYTQVWDFLSGAYDHQQMLNLVEIATRQLARRQLQWLRSLVGYQSLYINEEDTVASAHEFFKTVRLSCN